MASRKRSLRRAFSEDPVWPPVCQAGLLFRASRRQDGSAASSRCSVWSRPAGRQPSARWGRLRQPSCSISLVLAPCPENALVSSATALVYPAGLPLRSSRALATTPAQSPEKRLFPTLFRRPSTKPRHALGNNTRYRLLWTTFGSSSAPLPGTWFVNKPSPSKSQNPKNFRGRSLDTYYN